MMKKVISIAFLVALFKMNYLFAQIAINGKYIPKGDCTTSSTAGTSLIFNTDSTFNYTWIGHMIGDYGTGVYTIKSDTIFLRYNPEKAYDTSIDENGQKIVIAVLRYNSNRPDTLVYENDKLYIVERDKIIKRTQRKKVFRINKFRGWRECYSRKYFFFGNYFTKRKRTYYMRTKSIEK